MCLENNWNYLFHCLSVILSLMVEIYNFFIEEIYEFSETIEYVEL